MTSLGTYLEEASVSDWCFQAEPKNNSGLGENDFPDKKQATKSMFSLDNLASRRYTGS